MDYKASHCFSFRIKEPATIRYINKIPDKIVVVRVLSTDD